ncbi:sphingomyelin phosphodiesterase 5-like [Apus apus]|uniref:sphingomyelin phosphodiesterase 5-like n=1 Tax=Apus apus TaxID=8895 RepID=UPI0021F89743|nr:sphingomyelin phosphodiesterase 5-like [Apus apus]
MAPVDSAVPLWQRVGRTAGLSGSVGQPRQAGVRQESRGVRQHRVQVMGRAGAGGLRCPAEEPVPGPRGGRGARRCREPVGPGRPVLALPRLSRVPRGQPAGLRERGTAASDRPSPRAGHTRQEQGDVVVPLTPQPNPPEPPDPLSMLRESPFPSQVLVALDYLAQGLLAPSFWAVNSLLDLQQTTEERRQQRMRCSHCCSCARRALAGLVYVAVLLLMLPLTVPGLLLWLPVQAARRPFAYQHTVGPAPAEPWDLRQRRTFTILSANVCLLPSGLAKFSNLGRTSQRAAYLARHLAPASPEPAGTRAGLVQPWHSQANCYGGTHSSWASSATVEVPVEAAELVPEPLVLSEHFPADADVICLQEVFDASAAAILCQRLGGSFPHIIHGVGGQGLQEGCLKLLNSGLLLASRYQPLAAQYHGFPNGAREDALAAKGLLTVQVLLGLVRGRRVVGYISCTHLQAPAADGAIRDAQLTLVLQWLGQFRREQEQPGDVVAFDVFCGDLNFDNCSRGDKLNQRHQLFEEYWDPCRQGPGQDVPWAIGTLLNYKKIYEEPVSTPEKMKRTLSQPAGRQQFLAGPILSNGDPDPAATSAWQGRRVDYILYRPPPTAALLRTEVAGFSVITQLATRSDHLPVSLRLHVAPTPS